MKFILGKKVAMTQLWQNDRVVPVTKVTAGPCTVLQLKTVDQDGYRAVQVGYGARRPKLISKSLLGHFKENGNFRYVKEFRIKNDEKLDVKVGDQISVMAFAPGDKLTITGVSKGKGFQGVVKRHGFHGQDASHGNKDQLRMPGSIGATGTHHVLKGMRMPGRMGDDKVTLHDVVVIEVDEATNSLFVKGPLPGARNGLILLSGEGELKLGLPTTDDIDEAAGATEEKPTEEIKEEIKEEVKAEEEVKEEVKPASASDEATDEVKE